MTAYYNENDPKVAQWLRNLIARGLIAPGDVDDRSIEDVRPADLAGYAQCHFFAGIGVWSHALRRAGWPDDRPVWTGSCPCQPFSAAGKRGGTTDERHLWPAWFHLITHAKPRGVPVFGEQVASKDGLAWLDLVHADLERQSHTVRALDLCAAGVGAPHIRQRLFFVADRVADDDARLHGSGLRIQARQGTPERVCSASTGSSEVLRWTGSQGASGSRMADTNGGHASAEGLQRGGQHRQQSQDGRTGAVVVADAERSECGPSGIQRSSEAEGPAGQRQAAQSAGDGEAGGLLLVGHADDAGSQGRGVSGAVAGRDSAGERAAREAGVAGGMGQSDRVQSEQPAWTGTGPAGEGSAGPCGELAGSSPTAGFWHPADWLPCIDGKSRPVEPGTFPLAHGVTGRVVRLRAYGNAIVAPLAEEFIRAYLEVTALEQLL